MRSSRRDSDRRCRRAAGPDAGADTGRACATAAQRQANHVRQPRALGQDLPGQGRPGRRHAGGYFRITPRGQAALADAAATINNAYLDQFKEFQDFKAKVNEADGATAATPTQASAIVSAQGSTETPDEALRKAHGAITGALAADLLDRVRQATPAFFEKLIVELLLAMGYGGTSEEAGRALGQSGDGGVDGVIDQDPLGVDQIFVQAKRYAEGNNIGAGAIRDFYGALSLKKAHKGIFVTTSAFSQPAVDTARGLGSRIVLIDGLQLSRLMIRYNVGCRDEDVLHLKKVDEDFFED